MNALLNINKLSVTIPSRFGDFEAIHDIDLVIDHGQIHGLVGESGAGKSTIGAAIIGLLESPAYLSSGQITLNSDTLNTLTDEQYHKLRGNRISMIFQDPQTSLNPLLRISDQLIETIRQHSQLSFDAARQLAIELLDETGIANASERMEQYPHEFSGGMRQRVVIALALCTSPDLIIADEPTTALDVSIQKQILQLIKNIATKRGVGVLLITHDIGVIAEICDVVTVLRYGEVVEHGSTADVLGNPAQIYTQQLMAAVPRLDRRIERFINIVNDEQHAKAQTDWQIPRASAASATRWLLDGDGGPANRQASTELPDKNTSPVTTPALSVEELSVTFDSRRGFFRRTQGFKALDKISLSMQPGTVMGVVGESGSGKSTLAKAIAGLVPLASGCMHFNGQPLPDVRTRSRQHPARQQIQMVFQDPYSSLNNRRTVESILGESLRFYKLVDDKINTRRLIASVLELVEMPQRAMLKYPHQFSGGQRQRIAIARALMAQPQFLICDEPTSALDVSIQAQILNLLKDLQQELGLSILFISHDLAVVRQMADDVLLLRGGQLIEMGASEPFFTSPTSDYARQLLTESPSLALLSKA